MLGRLIEQVFNLVSLAVEVHRRRHDKPDWAARIDDHHIDLPRGGSPWPH